MKKALYIAGYIIWILCAISIVCTFLTEANTGLNILGIVLFCLVVFYSYHFGVKLFNKLF